MSDDLIARLKAAHEAATPGPWGPDVYVIAGEMPEKFGAGKCAYCRRGVEPVVRGRFDINGKVMPAHIHVLTDSGFIDPHTLVHFDGKHRPLLVAGNYDYDAGGIMSPEDAELIALTRNALPEIIAALEEREWLRAVVEVARATELREPDMRQGYWPHNWPEMQALRAALDALGKS